MVVDATPAWLADFRQLRRSVANDPPAGRHAVVSSTAMDDEPKTGQLDVSRALTSAMERAGVHPAYVHAVRICGFVYTQENAHTLSEAHIARWNAAVDAWFDANPDDVEASRRASPGPGPER